MYAAVLPEPVLDRAGRSELVGVYFFRKLIIAPNIFLPSRISGIALCWTGVGIEKFCCAAACKSRASRPRELKFDSFLEASFVSISVGTSCSSSLRFMTAGRRNTG